MNFLIDFIFTFLIVYLVYLLFINKRKKDYSKLKSNDEIVIFVNKFNIDVNKINYKFLVNVVSLINSLIISFTASLVTQIDSFVWSIVVCFIVIFVLIYSLFEIAGRYFKNMESKNRSVKVKKTKSKKKSEEN